jgi:hypothetical protein
MNARSRAHSVKIKGHSGCLVDVVSADGKSWVDKSAPPEYADRLRVQIQMQRDARRANRLDCVRIPAIHSEDDTADGGLLVRMEYLSFLDCLEFYSTASLDEVDGIAAHLIAYLEANLADCSLKPVEANVLLDKIESIDRQLSFTPCADAYRGLFGPVRRRISEIRGLSLPIGRTHGDLTLSNIMVASDLNCIGLFDFLDGYLESPLVDIAKVRQDTQFGWSSLMSETPVDQARFKQIMRHTDALIVEHFSKHEWFCRGIDLIQAVNLLRISPYAQSDATHGFVIDALHELGFDS